MAAAQFQAPSLEIPRSSPLSLWLPFQFATKVRRTLQAVRAARANCLAGLAWPPEAEEKEKALARSLGRPAPIVRLCCGRRALSALMSERHVERKSSWRRASNVAPKVSFLSSSAFELPHCRLSAGLRLAACSLSRARAHQAQRSISRRTKSSKMCLSARELPVGRCVAQASKHTIARTQRRTQADQQLASRTLLGRQMKWLAEFGPEGKSERAREREKELENR